LQDIAEEVAAIAEAKEDHWQYAEPELPNSVATIGLGIDGVTVHRLGSGFEKSFFEFLIKITGVTF
jgi:hypothetical protein